MIRWLVPVFVLGCIAGAILYPDDDRPRTLTTTVVRTTTVSPQVTPFPPDGAGPAVVCDRQRITCQQSGVPVTPPEVNGAECRARSESETWRWAEVSDFSDSALNRLARRFFEYMYVCYPQGAS